MIGKKKKGKMRWFDWWPVAVGVVITPVTVQLASLFVLSGPNGMRLLYPYVVLMQQRALGLPDDIAAHLAQLMMYIQFPLYGFLLARLLRRKDVFGAIMMTAVLHFAAVVLLLGLAQMHVS